MCHGWPLTLHLLQVKVYSPPAYGGQVQVDDRGEVGGGFVGALREVKTYHEGRVLTERCTSLCVSI